MRIRSCYPSTPKFVGAPKTHNSEKYACGTVLTYWISGLQALILCPIAGTPCLLWLRHRKISRAVWERSHKNDDGA
jgi:hypothetical protein